MLPETPADLRERQKSEVTALRKNQKAERDILNIIGKLTAEDAYRIMARITTTVGRVAGSKVVDAVIGAEAATKPHPFACYHEDCTGGDGQHLCYVPHCGQRRDAAVHA